MIKSIINVYLFIFKRVLHLEKWLLLVSLFSVVFLGILPTLVSYVFKLLVASLETNLNVGNSGNVLLMLCLLYVLFVVAKELLSVCRSTIYWITCQSLTFDMQNIILEKFKKIDFKVFFTQKFQNLYFNVLKNYNSEYFHMVTATITLLSSVIELIFILIILLHFDFTIVILLSLFAVPSILIRCKTQEKFISTMKENTHNERKNTYFFNILTDKSFLKEIRLFSLEDYFKTQRFSIFKVIITRWKKFGKNEFLRLCFAQLISFVGLFIAIYKIVLLTSQGNISIANFVFYGGIILSFQNSIAQLVFQFAESYRGILFITQLFDFFKLDEIEDYDNQESKVHVKNLKDHVIEFKNVSFRYSKANELVLNQINLRINQGEKICIVGKNGCGKSTLMNLLLRHYSPTDGQILLDGQDINSYNLSDYKKVFSGIYQDFQKYSTSVKNFIAFSSIDKEDELDRVQIAAKKAFADGFIENSPRKYESDLTRVFEKDGLELSGGQWQKLAIARVFFSENPILIFDEPTSSLDPVSEKAVFEELSKIKNKTIIFVTHRMSTLKYADKIAFMDQGRVLGFGKHSDLLQSCEKYKKLFESQN